jgi:prepilin-type N-terminal cleavage/methylation domain-containing protein
MNRKTPEKGFTLIELLVVIAVIGILASVVLASLNTSRGRASDAAVKTAMNTIRSQAELYYLSQTPNGYSVNGSPVTSCTSGIFADAVIASARAQIAAQALSTATISCATNTTGNKWAVSVSQLKSSGTSWCIDSSGSSGVRTASTSGTTQGTCI